MPRRFQVRDRQLGNGALGPMVPVVPPLPKQDPAYVEQIVERIRALYGMNKTPAKAGTLPAIFWDEILDEKGRRFFLGAVKLPQELAILPAREMETGQLQTVLDGYMRLCQWTQELQLLVTRARHALPR